jgi:hypothetical protein
MHIGSTKQRRIKSFALCRVSQMCASDFDCESWKCDDNRCAEDDSTLRLLASASGAAANKKNNTDTKKGVVSSSTMQSPAFLTIVGATIFSIIFA